MGRFWGQTIILQKLSELRKCGHISKRGGVEVEGSSNSIIGARIEPEARSAPPRRNERWPRARANRRGSIRIASII